MAATGARLASSERGPTMARMRTARWLDLIGYAALVVVLLVVIVHHQQHDLTQDSQRRQAVEAKEAATAEVQVLRSQQECATALQAKSDAALLAWLVALSSGEGGVEVARVDAQLAMQQWLDARERCAG